MAGPVNLASLSFFAAALLLAPLAALIYATRPASPPNRRLAMMLAAWFGICLAAACSFFTTDPKSAFAFASVMNACWFTIAPLYLRFAATFESPLTRPLKTRTADRILIAAAVAAPIVWLVVRPWFILGIAPGGAVSPLRAVYGHPWTVWGMIYSIVLTYSVLVTLDALRRSAPGSLRRRQLIAYAVGAAASDACNLAASLGFRPHIQGLAEQGIRAPLWEIQLYLELIALSGVVFALAMAYGIAKTQLFDIDLKLKWTLRRGTVTAAFVAVFFVASEGAQIVLSERLGPFVGLAAAGSLVFAMAPLQRFADRVADRAMPSVADTKEYRTVRTRDLYRAAVDTALEDGELTVKDRGMLATLAQQLELGAKDAHDIERDARQARAGAA